MSITSQDKPEISYPTSWSYRIVGTSEEAIRAHVVGLLGDTEHELELRRRSSGNRYVSLNLSLIVNDEAQRLALCNQIASHETVRFVV